MFNLGARSDHAFRLQLFRPRNVFPSNDGAGVFIHDPAWGKWNKVITPFWFYLHAIQISLCPLALVVVLNIPVRNLPLSFRKCIVLRSAHLGMYGFATTQKVQAGPSEQPSNRI